MSLYDELIQEGIEKGINLGIGKVKIEVILKAYDNQLSLSTIQLLTDESEEWILEVLREHGRVIPLS